MNNKIAKNTPKNSANKEKKILLNIKRVTTRSWGGGILQKDTMIKPVKPRCLVGHPCPLFVLEHLLPDPVCWSKHCFTIILRGSASNPDPDLGILDPDPQTCADPRGKYSPRPSKQNVNFISI